MFIVLALSNMGTWNHEIMKWDPKTQPFCKFGVLVHCLARKCECDRFARFFVAATAKLQKFVISKPNSSPSEQGSNRQHQLRLPSLYPNTWCQHYVMTSKEYLINCHILLQYFELLFLHLQLVKILCKLVIFWVNYEKNKHGSFFMKHRVYCCFLCYILFCFLVFTFPVPDVVLCWYWQSIILTVGLCWHDATRCAHIYVNVCR